MYDFNSSRQRFRWRDGSSGGIGFVAGGNTTVYSTRRKYSSQINDVAASVSCLVVTLLFLTSSTMSLSLSGFQAHVVDVGSGNVTSSSSGFMLSPPDVYRRPDSLPIAARDLPNDLRELRPIGRPNFPSAVSTQPSTIADPNTSGLKSRLKLAEKTSANARFRRHRKLRKKRAAVSGSTSMDTGSSTTFSGLPNSELDRLRRLNSIDPISAVFEYNEMVLKVGESDSKTCSMRLRYNATSDPERLAELFKNQVQSVLQTANTLNNAFLTVKDPSTLSDSFYLALASGLVSSNRLIYGAVIVLDPGHVQPPVARTSPHIPYVYIDSNTGQLQIQMVNVVREVTREMTGQQSGTANSTEEFGWYWRQRSKDFSGKVWPHRSVCERVANSASLVDPSRAAASSSSGGSQSASSLPPAAGTQATVVTTANEGHWGVPHFNCAQARSWTVAYSVPFFGCTSKLELGFRGVLKVDLDLGRVDINQCSTDSRQLFAGSHRCPSNTKCVHLPNRGFRRGSYRCECLPGNYRFISPTVSNVDLLKYQSDDASASNTSTGTDIDGGSSDKPPVSRSLSPAPAFNGSTLEKIYIDWLSVGRISGSNTWITTSSSLFRCVQCPCPDGKEKSWTCGNGSDESSTDESGSATCFADYDALIRGIPMAIQSLCVTITIVLTVIIVRLRKTKVIKASFWCFLEVVLAGALMLYTTVVIQYFQPNNISCLLIPWLREVGFAVVYGALILKVYRVLAEFQSRKAHRVQIRDKDLFKYLCCILIVVVGYMAAWTAVTLDYVGQQGSMLQTGVTADHLFYVVCQSKWWDYVVETAELLFIVFSIYVCYCTRAAPSNYKEVRYISAAVVNEAIISMVFYTARHVFWLNVHPDYIFLMYFLRCQLTVTVMLTLVLGPKLWYTRRPMDDDMVRGRAYSTCDAGPDSSTSPATGLVEASKMSGGLNLNGDVDVGEINLSEMNPEDIRCELKRLYTQLQIYKTKTMRQDNPHISKRRGGRKQTHRRFSLQAFHNKHKYSGGGSGGLHSGQSDRGSGGHGGGTPGGCGRGGEHSIAGGETEVSRSPEDSINSQEGVSVYADESSVAEVRSPTVTFKSGHRSGKHTS